MGSDVEWRARVRRDQVDDPGRQRLNFGPGACSRVPVEVTFVPVSNSGSLATVPLPVFGSFCYNERRAGEDAFHKAKERGGDFSLSLPKTCVSEASMLQLRRHAASQDFATATGQEAPLDAERVP